MNPLRMHVFIAIFLLLCGGIFLFLQEYHRLFDGKLHFYTFDIAEGDALLFKTPHGKIITIDGGIDETVISKVSPLLPFWRQRIDLLIVTHPDADHLNGALALLQKFSVASVLISGSSTNSSRFTEFLGIIERLKIPLLLADTNTDFTIDSVIIDTIFPIKNFVGRYEPQKNNTSVVVQLRYGQHSFLLTGDIEREVEEQILMFPTSLKSTVLKVAHHGSKTSSLSSFLQAVQPQYAIISAGADNRFGHPHPEIVQRLEKLGITTVVTKKSGDIHLQSDGKSLEWETMY